jgi:hypothetical protein
MTTVHLKHWEEWLPEKVKTLRAEGELDQELQGAAIGAQKQIDHLMRDRGYPEWAARGGTQTVHPPAAGGKRGGYAGTARGGRGGRGRVSKEPTPDVAPEASFGKSGVLHPQ